MARPKSAPKAPAVQPLHHRLWAELNAATMAGHMAGLPGLTIYDVKAAIRAANMSGKPIASLDQLKAALARNNLWSYGV